MPGRQCMQATILIPHDDVAAHPLTFVQGLGSRLRRFLKVQNWSTPMSEERR